MQNLLSNVMEIVFRGYREQRRDRRYFQFVKGVLKAKGLSYCDQMNGKGSLVSQYSLPLIQRLQ